MTPSISHRSAYKSVALVGNPNTGKTTLFNQLSGAHQKVGNWPGVTVEKKVGRLKVAENTIELVDLPGIYSLEQDCLGVDEAIAKDYLASSEADIIINILDASNLERNLVLTQQILDQKSNLIVVLNMLDVAQQQGVCIDIAGLTRRLGVRVVPLVASSGVGMGQLKAALSDVLTAADMPDQGSPAAVKDRQIQDTDSTAEKLIKRYHHARALADGVVEIAPAKDTLTEKIDYWVLNRWLGLPVFLLMMYLMFTIAINLGAVFIDFFDILFAAVFVDGSRLVFEQTGLPEWATVILSNGFGGGIQLVATFVPVIGFLFLCLSFLEDSGYMSRAAFVVDSLMGKLGLPGSAFVPLIVGFGCNVPSIMAARSLGRESDRLLTIAMSPFMSCGARLTVYALFAAALFQQSGQNIVFMLYLMGIGMAVLTGFIFRKQIFEGEITPSFQEMPAYHVPVLRNILFVSWFRLKSFIVRAGRTIILVVVGLSFLNSLSFDGSFGNEDTEASALSTIGKTITPVFQPVGIKEDNWPATVGLFTGLFAKEAVVGTLNALYSAPDKDNNAEFDLLASTTEAFSSIADNALGLVSGMADPLGLSIGDLSDSDAAAEAQGVSAGTLTNMAQLFGDAFSAFCYLVFILLYAPCIAVLGAISKEAGWRWSALVFSWTTILAYTTASSLYQLGNFMAEPLFSASWIVGCGLVMTVFIVSLKRLGKGSVPSNLISTLQIG